MFGTSQAAPSLSNEDEAIALLSQSRPSTPWWRTVIYIALILAALQLSIHFQIEVPKDLHASLPLLLAAAGVGLGIDAKKELSWMRRRQAAYDFLLNKLRSAA